MKKLVTLLLAAGMVCSFSSHASAVELKASGEFDFSFERTSLNPYKGDNANRGNNKFNALQRVRIAFDFIASEQLSGRYMFQVGTGYWGETNNSDFSQGQRDDNNAQINTRMAYVDWLVPGTSVKVSMGKKPLALPAFTIGGFIQGGITNSIQIAAPINNNFAMTAFWMRPMADDYNRTDTGKTANPLGDTYNRFGDIDVFGLTVPMQFSGFDFVPWAAYGSVGNRAGAPTADATSNNIPGGIEGYLTWRAQAGRNGLNSGTSNLWYVGFASRLTMFDPFTFALDAAYGSRGTSNGDGVDVINPYYTDGSTFNSAKSAERSGWYVSALASYKTPYGVPTLKAWYASGDDGKQTKAGGNMPILGANIAGGVAGASTFFDGGWSLGNTAGVTSGTGLWAVSAQWNQASFIQDLFHDLSVTYICGTNDADNVRLGKNGTFAAKGQKDSNSPYAVTGYTNNSDPFMYMTDKDSAIDVNLVSTYSIYKNLATSLELGYVFQNFDEDIRATAYNPDGTIATKPDFKNIWRVAVNFRYTF